MNTPSSSHLNVCLIASGSKGNAIYISNGQTSILIDVGLSGKQIEKRMQERGLNPEAVQAILVSHEHRDHIHGVGILSRRYAIPVYINRETWRTAREHIGQVKKHHFFTCGQSFTIDGFTIHPFGLSHDAVDPTGFTISSSGLKVGIATDLGLATTLVKEHLRDAHLLVLEANHDTDMLLNGPYPWSLKQRIKSRTGHLSNTDARELIMELKNNRLKHVILAHLSDTNNTAEKAYNEVCVALEKTSTELKVVTQDACGPLIRLKH
jgi:phosphoribosyl 1,2-cyclic phosphodiesterase